MQLSVSESAYADVNITTCDQLIGSAAVGTNLRDNPAETYIQQNDIDCAGQEITVNFPSSTSDFAGVYEGGGFAISNFIVPASTRSSLFGYTEGATIQNLTIDSATVACNTSGNCGILAADDRSSTFDNITISNSTLLQEGGQDNMGSIFGIGLGSQLSNITLDSVLISCTSFFSGACQNIGGAVGSLDQNTGVKGSIDSVTAINLNINGKDNVGGVVGSLGESDISNSYAQGFVNGYDKTGGVVGVIIGDASIPSVATNLSADTIYDPQAYLDLVGTASTNTNNSGGIVGRMSNYSYLNCSGTTSSYKSIGTISSSNIGGVVGIADFEVASSDLDNFKIENCNVSIDITGRNALGGIVGNANEGRINNVNVSGVIKIQGSIPTNIGGVVGTMDFDAPSTRAGISNCSFQGNIFTDDSLVAPQSIAGIAGDVDNVSIDSCTVNADISAPGATRVAGIIAQAAGTNNSSDNKVLNSSFSGTLIGKTYIAGIIANSTYYDVSSSTSSGTILGNTEENTNYAGGIIGFSTGSSTDISNVSQSSSSMSIDQVVSHVGGLIGYTTFTSVTESYATGNVDGYRQYVGGLIGRIASGNSSVIIDQVYSTGDVTGGISFVGGLIGDLSNATQVSNAYALGDVSGADFVGGLVGQLSNSSLLNSFSSGLVSGVSNFGGLIGTGNNGNTVTESYWDLDTSNQSISHDGIGKTTQELYTPATFSTWDTTTIWEACDNAYPVLRNLGQSCPVPDPEIFIVNSSLDTSDETNGDGICADIAGRCTLRAAIEEVNALNNAALNIISFDLDASETVIQIDSALPTLSNLQVSVDGTSQQEYVGEPVVALDGSNLTTTDPILEFSNTDNSSIKGLAIYGLNEVSDYTVQITNSDNFVVQSNFFGYNLAQQYLTTNSTNSLYLDRSSDSIIKDNFIANSVLVTDSGRIIVQGNTLDLSNNSESDYAIQFIDGQDSIISKNDISNVNRGVVIRDDSASSPVTGNDVRENLGSNVFLMIDLLDDSNGSTDGKNPNDLDDEDDGPNNLLNSPALTSASYDNSTRTLTVDGLFNSDDGNYRFDFYASDGADEALEYLNYFLESVAANNLTFTAKTLIVPERGIAPSFVTATSQDSEGNTSELSQPIAVDAILITSCDQLAGGNPAAAENHIEDDYSGFYKLANDVDCSSYTGGSSFDPIGSNTTSQYFTGVLDGAGFKITNLEISETTSYNGLFARTDGAIIQNLTVENISLTCSTTSADYCGSIAGYSDESSFKSIVLLTGSGSAVNAQGTYTGALTGYTLGSQFKDISSDLNVVASTTNENYVGGLVGYTRFLQPTNRAYVYNVFENITVTADVTGFTNVGGVIGFAQDVEVDNASYTGEITHAGNTIGGLIGSLSSYTFSDLISNVQNSSVSVTTVSQASQNRTELGAIVGDMTKSKLKNITASGSLDATNYFSVGGAIGYAFGDSNQRENNQLLTTTTSTVDYLDVDVNISNAINNVGGIGGNIGYYKISNSSFDGDITHDSPTTTHQNLGGLIGTSTYLDLRNSTATSSQPIAYALSNSGGAVGATSNSYLGNVSSDISMPGVVTNGGGLIGDASTVNIYNSYATGDTGVFKDQSSTASIGGLVGRCRSFFCNIYDSYATGDVTGERLSVGGLVGNLNATDSVVQNSYATGDVLVEGLGAGGLIGDLSPSTGQSDIINSYATGSVSSIDYAYMGGLIGRTGTSGTINVTESYSSSTVTAPSTSVSSYNICGGLIGQANTLLNVIRSYSYGPIDCPSITSGSSAINGVGGLVGDMNNGSIIDSYSHSDITVNYSNDNVSRFERIGGLVGYIATSTIVTDSYATGSITNLYTPTDPADEPILGGLVGESPSTTYTDSFWDTQTSGITTSAGGTGLLTSEMQDQNTFTTNGVTWDFATTWEMCPGGGYPTHQWMNYCPLDDPYSFIINSTSDSNDTELGDRTCLDALGECTLRAALQELSFMINNEQISVNYNLNFNIPGAGPHIITLDNSLGTLGTLSGLTKFTIDGESEPDYSSGPPVVYIDGANLLGADGSILTISESSNLTIQGLGFINLNQDNSAMIRVQDSSNVTIDNSYIALDSNGDPDSSSSESIIGVELSNTTGSSVINSFFGRNISLVNNSASNDIRENTMYLSDSNRSSAVYIEGSSQNNIESNQLENTPIGIIVNQPTGQIATQNRLSQNTAFGLTDKMIELQVDGVPSADANDIAQDLDGGANTLLNFPVISDGEFNQGTSTLSVQGTVETSNGTNYILQFYNSDGANDEALDFLGSSDPFTVSDNLYSFDVDLTGIGITPLNTTAILIDESGNTSQHSQSQSLNEAPSNILISQDTFPENPQGDAFDSTIIATLTAVDDDVSDTHTFEIISIDGDVDSTDFAIGGVSGDSLVQNVPFDFEAKTSYSILIQTTDNKGVSFQKAIIISVTDLNDNAPDLLPENFSVSEDNNAPATTLTVNDLDTVGTIALVISGGADQDDFDISGTTLGFKDSALPLDFETKSSYTVEVTVSDGENANDTEVFNFTVTDVNEPPFIVSPQGDVNATQGDAINSIDLSNVFDDVDAGANGDLTIEAVQVGQLSLPAWLTLEGVSLTGTPANEDVGTVDIQVTATDQPGLSVSDTFSITVANINDAPIIDDQTVGSVSESGPDGAVVGSIIASDPDTPYGDTLTFSITSGNEDLDGDTIRPYSIDESTGELTLSDSGDVDFETASSSSLVVTVTDAGTGNLTNSATVVINILDANDTAPIFISPAAFSVSENQTEVGIVQVTDVDEENNFKYSVSGGVDADLFQIDQSTGVLEFISAPDNESPQDANLDNIYQVVVAVDDGASNVTVQLISVQVENVEEDSDVQPSSSGASGGSAGTSTPFSGSSDGDEAEGPGETVESNNSGIEDESEIVNPPVEDSAEDSPQDESSTEQEAQDASEPEDAIQEDPGQASEPTEQDVEDEPEVVNPPVEDSAEDGPQVDDSAEQDQDTQFSEEGDDSVQDSSNNFESSDSGSSSQINSILTVFSSPAKSYVRPDQPVITCDDFAGADLSDVDTASLDCDPLGENLEPPNRPTILLNLPQSQSTGFPSDEIFITGKTYGLEDISEVEVYSELTNGSQFALGVAKVDVQGNFSLLNNKSLPKDSVLEIKARAVSSEDIVSPDYPIQIKTKDIREIPTSLISFTNRTSSSLLQNEDGYFSFVDTQELLDGLELRVKSEFRTRHDIYWNSVLIGSSAINGSNSDQTVIYAPEEVIRDIDSYSRHKITIVAQNIDDPSQKGVPLVINYLYIPTYAYYVSYVALFGLAALAFIFIRRKRKVKLSKSGNETLVS